MEFKPGNLSVNQCNNLCATWHLVLFLTVMPNATEQYQTAYQGERRKVNCCLKWEWSAKWKAKYCLSVDCNLWACASFIVSWFISLLLCFSQLSNMWVQKHKTAIVDFKALIGFTEMLVVQKDPYCQIHHFTFSPSVLLFWFLFSFWFTLTFLFPPLPLILFLLCLFLQHNDVSKGMDINVTGVWERNITGQGVTVVVVDDGVEHTHQDIQPNYVSQNCLSNFLIYSYCLTMGTGMDLFVL